MPLPSAADYLRPYHDAVRRFGPTFRALLWQNRTTQRVRFDALRRLVALDRVVLCDAGCGHADLLDFLASRGIQWDHYTGIEAQSELASVAARRAARHRDALVVRGDFVAEPRRLMVGADVTYFGGSLNTMGDDTFRRTLELAADVTAGTVAVSFLSSTARAGESHLRWRTIPQVAAWAGTIGTRVRWLDDYLEGDATLAFDTRGR